MNITVTNQQEHYEPPLLGPGEPPPFTVLNPDGAAPCLIISDHTGQAVPKKLGAMGLGAAQLEHHAAVDLGVRYVTEQLADKLGATAIMANYSRLVVDLNRRLDHPTAFPVDMEGTPVPGNEKLSAPDRACRIAEIYDPYHDEVARLIARYRARNIVPVIISLHSFTPVFYKQPRPWEIGILWVHDQRVPLALIRYFAKKGYCVGNNEPYDARILRGTTLNRHADAQRLPNALIEYRNDQIAMPQAADPWVDMTAEAIAALLDDPATLQLYDGPQLEYDNDKALTYFDELAQRAKREG